MFTVNVLKDCDGKIYKGATSILESRLKDHMWGGTKTTSRMKDFDVIYKEEYDSWEKARSREKYLKSSAGRRFLKKYCARSSVGRAAPF